VLFYSLTYYYYFYHATGQQCQANGTAGVCCISYQGSLKQSTSTLICTVHTRSHNIEVQPQNENTHNRQHIANHSQLQLIFIHAVSFG